MAKRKNKKKEQEQRQEKPKTVKCPLRGHNHELLLIHHPGRPDLLIAQCGGRDVYQVRAAEKPRPVEPAIVDYVVPKFEGVD